MDLSYRDRIYSRYATHFQEVAAFDVAASRKWGRPYAHYFRRWLPVSKTSTIADVACGGGKLLHFLKERGYVHLCGVDLSEEQVALARHVVQHVQKGDAIAFLKSNIGAFDLITGIDIVEHLHKADVLHFIDAAFDALRPHGRLVLQTPNADAPFCAAVRYGDFTHEVCFNASVLSRLLTLSGFTTVEARELGPVPWGHGLAATVRAGVWQCIRIGCKVWHAAEVGHEGSGIFTRVFLISAIKN